MSSARGRSWRPERKVNAKESRNRTIIVLVGLLVALVGFLAITPFLREPAVRFVSLMPDEYQPDRTGLPVLPPSPATVSSAALHKVFQKLHELSEDRVLNPERVESPEELNSAVDSDKRLILYSAWDTVVAYDKDSSKAVLKFRPSGKQDASQDVPVAEFLASLNELRAEQITLLLDPPSRTSGLANGGLSDDAMPLLAAAIDEANLSKLVVICAHDAGQRSWEYAADSDSAADASTEDESAVASDPLPAVAKFSGTAFGHFVRQAVMDGHTGTPNALFSNVRDNVSKWVESQYGENQTVVMLPKQAKADRGLLDAGRRLSESDLQEKSSLAEAAAKAVAAAEGSEDADAKKAEVAAAEQSKQDSDEAHLQQQIELRNQLAASGDAAAAMPDHWVRLNASLLAAEFALLNGDQAVFESMYEDVKSLSTQISDQLIQATTTNDGSRFSPWLTFAPSEPAASDQVTPELLRKFPRTVRDVGAAEDPGSLDDDLTREGVPRDAFVEWFVADLNSLAKIAAAQQSEKLAVAARFLQRLPGEDWPKNEWPQEFFTVDEVLGAAGPDDYPDLLKPLLDLIEARRSILSVATGKLPDGRLIRSDVWDQAEVQNGIRETLTRLTAAERWLALGPPGLDMAQQKLNEALASTEQLKRALAEQQSLVSLKDQQTTDLPLLIQFIAQQQEEVPFERVMFESAAELADAALNATAGVDTFPVGLFKQPGLSQADINAMFALTRDYSQSDPPRAMDRDHLIRLKEYIVERVSDASTSSERMRLMSLPGLGGQRFALVDQLTSAGRPTEIGDDRRTGLWLSFWSIRLLDAATKQKQTDLWKQWQDLINLRSKGHSAEVVSARARLASSLRTAWNDLRPEKLDRGEKSRPIFVSLDRAKELVAADLAQRHEASDRNRQNYASIYSDVTDAAPPTTSYALQVPNAPRNLVNLRAEVPLTIQGATRLYVSQANVDLQNKHDKLTDTWRMLDNVEANTKLTFRSSGGVTDKTQILLAIANQDDIVVATKPFVLEPDPNTEWQVQFFAKSDPTRPLRLLNNQLELPPTTRDEKGKDKPVALLVRLKQESGRATSVAVQCRDSAGKAFWPGAPRVLKVENKLSEFLPLKPIAAADTPPPAAAAVPESFDLLDGITFEITANGAPAEPIKIYPKLTSPSAYVQVSRPKHDGNSPLTFTVTPREANDTLRPEKIGVQVHFNPELERLREGGGSTGLPSLPESGQTFTYTFNDKIQGLYESERLEFGLSVAGVPHAFRYRLRSSGVDHLDSELTPVVRTELELADSKVVKPVPGQDVLMVGENWVQAELNVLLHIHGGERDFAGGEPNWVLQLQAVDAANIGAQPFSIMNPQKLRRKYDETIQAVASEDAAWNVSTHTALWGIRGYNISANRGNNGDGRYNVIGRLSHASGGLSNEDSAEFVFDATAPKIGAQGIELVDYDSRQGWPADKPLIVRIPFEDAESGVADISAGLIEGEMRPLKVSELYRATAQLKIQPDDPGVPQFGPNDRRQQATLYIQAANRAGVKTEVTKKTILFSPPAASMAAPSAEPGAIEYKSESGETLTLILEGSKLKSNRSKSGKGKVVFEDVPPGTYKLYGVPGGMLSVTVKPGETTKLPEEEPVKPEAPKK